MNNPFRDDRDALRYRVEQLARENEQLRAELERTAAKGSQASQPDGPPASDHRSLMLAELSENTLSRLDRLAKESEERPSEALATSTNETLPMPDKPDIKLPSPRPLPARLTSVNIRSLCAGEQADWVPDAFSRARPLSTWDESRLTLAGLFFALGFVVGILVVACVW